MRNAPLALLLCAFTAACGTGTRFELDKKSSAADSAVSPLASPPQGLSGVDVELKARDSADVSSIVVTLLWVTTLPPNAVGEYELGGAQVHAFVRARCQCSVTQTVAAVPDVTGSLKVRSSKNGLIDADMDVVYNGQLFSVSGGVLRDAVSLHVTAEHLQIDTQHDLSL